MAPMGAVPRTSAAALLSAGLAWLAVYLLAASGSDETAKTDSLVLLVVGGAVGVGSYVLAARLFGVSEVGRIVSLLTSRLARR